MGTLITLDVGGISLTCSKNYRGMDHGSLFQECDRKRLESGQVDGDPEDGYSMSGSTAFSRPLKSVIPRLELLGFSLNRVQSEYEQSAKSWREEHGAPVDNGTELPLEPMTFAEFRQFATEHPLSDLDAAYRPEVEEKDIRGRFANISINRIPNYDAYDHHAYSEKNYFEGLVNILHPYSVMRLLAEVKANEDAPVTWWYGPLVEAGWASEQEFIPHARRRETFFIATEGSSDVHIIKHALALLRPGIADLFRFIDVSQSHPFPGIGGLVKFAEGLAKIDVQNQVLFLFDNDAEGLEAYQRVSTLTLPANMRASILPELDEFRAFPAEGPEGLRQADINCRAAAIECYLDLNIRDYPPAKVIWTNYKKGLSAYHGSLEYKESYVAEFLKQTHKTIAGSYNSAKIEAVLNLIAAQCMAISSANWD